MLHLLVCRDKRDGGLVEFAKGALEAALLVELLRQNAAHIALHNLGSFLTSFASPRARRPPRVPGPRRNPSGKRNVAEVIESQEGKDLER